MYKYNHDCPFEAYITNLGKYNEGELVGEWVKFPTTKEYLEEVFKRIGIGSTDEFGQVYEEWFISDYDVYVDDMDVNDLGEHASVDLLNQLATAIVEMDISNYCKYCAVLEEGSYSGSVELLLEGALHLDEFELIEHIHNEFELGQYVLENNSQTNEWLINYIDFNKLGRDFMLEQSGCFTKYGYLQLI